MTRDRLGTDPDCHCRWVTCVPDMTFAVDWALNIKNLSLTRFLPPSVSVVGRSLTFFWIALPDRCFSRLASFVAPRALAV